MILPPQRRGDLIERQWKRMVPLLPAQNPKTGRPSKDHRTMINGMLWILRTGAPWRDLPERYGGWETVAGRFYRWRRSGIWQKILQCLQPTCWCFGATGLESALCRWQRYSCSPTCGWSKKGCVAKTGDGLVKVAIVLTGLSHQHTLHKLQISLQVASLSFWNHPLGCPLVLPLSDQLPLVGGRDDVWSRGGSRSQHAFSLGPEVCARIG